MSRKLFLLAAIYMYAPAAAFGQLPPTGYIGLFADDHHATWAVDGEVFYFAEMWIWCLPGERGQMCAEFMISYPANVIPLTITSNDLLISEAYGSLEGGISVCYSECQWDWNWPFHQTLWVIGPEKTYVSIVPHPGSGAYRFANCDPGFPAESCIKFTDLYINQVAEHGYPYLKQVIVISPTVLDAVFNRYVVDYTAYGWNSNFKVHEAAGSPDITCIVKSELQQGWSTIRLMTDSPLEEGVAYILDADGICSNCGFCMDSELEFQFGGLPELPDLTITSLDADLVRAMCAPYDFSFGLANCGYTPAGAFRVSVSIHAWFGRDNVVVIPLLAYDGLGAGEKVTQDVSIILPPGLPTDNYLAVNVDNLEQVEEHTGFNNTMEMRIRNYCPKILSITDVPADGGGWVGINFSRSWADRSYLSNPVTRYEILRRIDPAAGCLSAVVTSADKDIDFGYDPNIESRGIDMAPVTVEGCRIPGGWELVGEVAAVKDDNYYVDAPTAADSSFEHGMYWSVYEVRAVRQGQDTTVHYVSCPDSGYSVDNADTTATLLRSFSASYSGSAVEIAWRLSETDGGAEYFIRRADGSGELVELPVDGIKREGAGFSYLDGNVEPGKAYRYRVGYTDGGNRHTLFETDPVVIPDIPLTLYQNIPNPFNPATTITYYLPGAADVILEVYDVSGRRVCRLVHGRQNGGRHSVEWTGLDGGGTPSAPGVYFYCLRAGKEAVSRKMVLLR